MTRLTIPTRMMLICLRRPMMTPLRSLGSIWSKCPNAQADTGDEAHAYDLRGMDTVRSNDTPCQHQPQSTSVATPLLRPSRVWEQRGHEMEVLPGHPDPAWRRCRVIALPCQRGRAADHAPNAKQPLGSAVIAAGMLLVVLRGRVLAAAPVVDPVCAVQRLELSTGCGACIKARSTDVMRGHGRVDGR